VAVAGPFAPALAGSELEKQRGRLARGLPPVDLARHAAALAALCEAVRGGELTTAHDISEGGLACALAECCIEGDLGARIDLGSVDDEALFGEGPGGAVVAGPRPAVEALPGAVVIGEVGGSALEIAGAISLPVERLRADYEDAIPAALA
jgi:phosphoribosylformylglycinamidine synthase subunit PurL